MRACFKEELEDRISQFVPKKNLPRSKKMLGNALYKAKCVSLPSGGGRSLGAKISGGKGHPQPIY